MRLESINTGFFKLDGGAMFGVVPRRMWEKLNPPDDNNLCTWSMRCLYIETGDHKILVDTGIGNKQDAKFRSHFEPQDTDDLAGHLAQKGIDVAEITDVLLTHLHFDHVGGALRLDTEGGAVPTFPNARYWTNRRHWDWAMTPNPREQASFLKENFVPLQTLGRLHFIEDHTAPLFPNISIKYAYGHTEAMMMLKIEHGDQILFYCADTIPSSWHINMPYVMAYDVRPLETLREKNSILDKAAAENWILLFEHDPFCEAATVKRSDSGRIVVDAKGTLTDFL